MTTPKRGHSKQTAATKRAKQRVEPRLSRSPRRGPLRAEPRPSINPTALDERIIAPSLLNDIREHTDTSPALSAGDLDAAWQDAGSGEELAGGSAPTPGQDSVDAIGEALGVPYREGEILHTEEKLALRDEHRWELDPASSEDFSEREAERHRVATPAPPVATGTQQRRAPAATERPTRPARHTRA